MFNEYFINLIYRSWMLEKWYIKIIMYITIILVIWIILLLFVWLFIENYFIDYTKVKSISVIIVWLFWWVFLLSILSFAVKWEAIKEELLKRLKEITNKKWWFINFSLNRINSKYKTIYEDDEYYLMIWVDEDDKEWDYGRFFLYNRKSSSNFNYKWFKKDTKKDSLEKCRISLWRKIWLKLRYLRKTIE